MQSEVIARAAADQLEMSPVPDTPVPRVGGRRIGLPVWASVLVTNPLSLVGCILLLIIVLAAVCAPLLTTYAPDAMLGPLGARPSSAHWLGTNDQGQDIFAQIVFGARYSLSVGFGAGLAIAAIATFVGMIAGYARGWLDDVLTLVMNIFLIIPQLPLLVVIAAYIPLRGDNVIGAIALMAGVITVTGWAWGARVIRSQTLSLRGRDFIQASVVSGETSRRIIFVEMLPNMISLIVNTVIMSSMGAILTEAALDYLGIGNISQITWGTMLYHAQASSVLFSGEWWVFVCPGLAIAMTTMSMILINNGIDAISNPRLRTMKRPPRVADQHPLAAGLVEQEAVS